MILTKTGFGLDTDIIFQKQYRIGYQKTLSDHLWFEQLSSSISWQVMAGKV